MRYRNSVRFALAALALAGAARAEPITIFFDNDFLGPGQSNIQSLIPLLRDERVELVGIGVVTGDAWLEEESQHLLRFLEIAQRPRVKVYKGAEMPLLRTPREMQAWEARFGRVPFKGAWSTPRPDRNYHPDDPKRVPPLPEGTPRLKPERESAVTALIAALRARPHEVTIVVAGPLTNIALALRVAPDIAELAKEIVIEGGNVDVGIARATGNSDYATDFNFLFDPEAAHIVLTAPWPKITLLGNAAAAAHVTTALLDRVAAPGRPVGTYLKTYARLGQPMWDEITAAVAIDRSLVTDELVARMDVEVQPGAAYGQAQIWKAEMAPEGTRDVHIVRAIDADRFLARYIEQAIR